MVSKVTVTGRANELIAARRHTVPAGMTVAAVDGGYVAVTFAGGAQVLQMGWQSPNDVTGHAVRDAVETCIGLAERSTLGAC
jgi:hypothetical protein